MYANEMMTIGELMEIKIEPGFTKTKLQDMYENERFSVLNPTVKGIPIRLENGGGYTFRFCRSNGVFSFEARLVNNYLQDGIRMCLFESQTEVVRSQRRQSFRLPIKLDVLLYMDSEKQEKNPATVKAKTMDLSEHGMLITSFTRVEANQKVIAELKLSPVDSIALKAKVLRCEKPLDKNDPYRIVLVFDGNSDRQKSDIGRYILQQQIVARKKNSQEVKP